MFWLAPTLVFAAGKVIYDLVTEDEYETTTYSNKSEKEDELVKTTKIEKNNKIYEDIKVYKSKQVKRFKDKYDVDIKFYGGKSKSSSGKSSFETSLSEKISVNKKDELDTVSLLEQETEEMIKLIGKLEVSKYETTK